MGMGVLHRHFSLLLSSYLLKAEWPVRYWFFPIGNKLASGIQGKEGGGWGLEMWSEGEKYKKQLGDASPGNPALHMLELIFTIYWTSATCRRPDLGKGSGDLCDVKESSTTTVASCSAGTEGMPGTHRPSYLTPPHSWREFIPLENYGRWGQGP